MNAWTYPKLIAISGLLLATACGGGGSSGGEPVQPPPSSDIVAPTIESVYVVPEFSEVVISWRTDEPADSQIQYGATSAYGASTPTDATLVTTHSATITGLTPASTYHFSVRSRDAVGNLAAASDHTFVTLASAGTPAASVAITEPADQAVVAGAAVVAATAAHEGGIAGVQFRIDSQNLGAEDTISPYSISWDSTQHVNGVHTLVAIARDAAGNITTSSAITVTVDNSFADTTPPAVNLTTPAGGSILSAITTVSADATDDIDVAGVQFLLDGVALDPEDVVEPYSIRWNTAQTANGAHTLSARARDAAGNVTTSASIDITVSNAPAPVGAAIEVGQVEIDPPTLEALGVSLPIVSGDTNYNAGVNMRYRRTGDATWLDALPLFRVRPELLSEEDPTAFTVNRQFAGSIFDLTPDTEYEVALDIQDPDGGSTTRAVTARTRPVPASSPNAPRVVLVSTVSALNSALANATPGDVITLANGSYSGSIAIANSGTAQNPIFVRGESRDGVIIDAPGASAGVIVSGRYVTLESLTIRSSSWGVRVTSSEHVVLRRLRITDVSMGIEIRGGTKRDHYVCDNLLEGREAQWPETSSEVWDFEGIVVTGAGHVVCHNTLSGFGDALGMHHNTAIPNRANDFYGNEVLWTGDNGVELDFGERNVRALRNRFTNGGNHSMSYQPVYGGPAYAIRNVMFNSAVAPFKFNNEPTGIIALHNTAVRSGIAWAQYGARADNFIVQNNIFIGTANQVVDMSTAISLARIDSNGWLPDGIFRFFDTWRSFADLQGNSPYEPNGRLLNESPFAVPLVIPASHTTFVQPLNAALSAITNALDAAVRLPNVNDGFTGANPDLGAVEHGMPAPGYGVQPVGLNENPSYKC